MCGWCEESPGSPDEVKLGLEKFVAGSLWATLLREEELLRFRDRCHIDVFVDVEVGKWSTG